MSSKLLATKSPKISFVVLIFATGSAIRAVFISAKVFTTLPISGSSQSAVALFLFPFNFVWTVGIAETTLG